MRVARTTVYLDRADYDRLKVLARARRCPPAALIREAVAEYARRHGGRRVPKSVGAGRSGRGDLSEQAEELLAGMGRPLVIVADTGAVLALIDADDGHHETLAAVFREDPSAWILPWAVLPEVDFLLGAHLGSRAQGAFLSDFGRGEWIVDWGGEADLRRVSEIASRYKTLRLGLVDAAVIAAAERLRATAIATLDLRHFGAVAIRGRPRLTPRDL